MGKGLPRSLSRGSPSGVPVKKVNIPVTALALAVADGAPGFGTVVIGGLPEGNILFLGAVAYMQLTTVSSTIVAAFTGAYSIGSAPTADNSLSGSEVDIIGSTTLSAATAKVSPMTRGAKTGAAILDNTDGSLELNLNVLIDDASISGAATFTVSGVVSLAYVVLADD